MNSKYDWDRGQKGYISRDYEDVPEFSVFADYSNEFAVIPRSQWWERYQEQKEAKSSALDRHQRNCEVYNQGSLPYCWQYACVAAMANVMSRDLDHVPDLNPHSTACIVKNYAKRGGFGAEGCKGLVEHGCATKAFWPGYSMDRNLKSDRSVKLNMQRNRMVEFREISREGIWDSLVSALLNGHPTAVGYNWWRHEVCALGASFESERDAKAGKAKITFVNSWGKRYGNQGYGELTGSKAVPFEATACVQIKVRKND